MSIDKAQNQEFEQIGTDALSTSDAPFLVFISYRVDPDQSIAIALKELIEGAIEPKPRVFVSGDGGLRPSSVEFKPQIQAAVQSARAFVAVITQKSKDREWMFFEAGSAWGRNQQYCPLLIDTSPSDLGSSIAGYLAVKATDRFEVERLVESIAQAIGGKTKLRFGTRFRAFEKRIQAYRSSGENSDSEAESTPLGEAIALLAAGETDEANQRFAEIESTENSPEEKSHVRVIKLTNSDLTIQEILNELDTLESDYGITGTSQYWRGFYESRPSAAIKFYQNCIRLFRNDRDEYLCRSAIIEIAREQFRISDFYAAYGTIREALSDGSRNLRSLAAHTWSGFSHEPHIFEKLVLLSTALLDIPDSSEILKSLAELTMSEEWHDLLVYFARRAGRKTGTTANNLGRAYTTVELHSLSYMAYSDAAAQGVSVAKVNMAAMTNRDSVPAIGLKLMQEHVGSFDAADAGFPYDVRADLERAVQKEEKTAMERHARGHRLFTALSNFGWEAARGTLPYGGMSFSFGDEIGSFSDDSDKLVLASGATKVVFDKIGDTIRFLANCENSAITFITLSTDGSLVQLRADLKDGSVIPSTSVHQLAASPTVNTSESPEVESSNAGDTLPVAAGFAIADVLNQKSDAPTGEL